MAEVTARGGGAYVRRCAPRRVAQNDANPPRDEEALHSPTGEVVLNFLTPGEPGANLSATLRPFTLAAHDGQRGAPRPQPVCMPFIKYGYRDTVFMRILHLPLVNLLERGPRPPRASATD